MRPMERIAPRGTPIPAPIATLCEASWVEEPIELDVCVVVVETFILEVRLELKLLCVVGIVDRRVEDDLCMLDGDAVMGDTSGLTDEVDAAVITVIVE